MVIVRPYKGEPSERLLSNVVHFDQQRPRADGSRSFADSRLVGKISRDAALPVIGGD